MGQSGSPTDIRDQLNAMWTRSQIVDDHYTHHTKSAGVPKQPLGPAENGVLRHTMEEQKQMYINQMCCFWRLVITRPRNRQATTLY
jgi:hypothetical protein